MSKIAPETWLICGASGLLGRRLVSVLNGRGHRVVAHHHVHAAPNDVIGVVADLAMGQDAARRLLDTVQPTVVVNCIGLTDVDRCEADERLARILNTWVAEWLTNAAQAQGCAFIHISTDHLWDGRTALIDEDTPPCPLNAYGRTKAAAEASVEAGGGLIIRKNFFGPSSTWRQSFTTWLSDQLEAGKSLNAFEDVYFTPILSDLLAASIIDLYGANARGIYHVAGGERISKFDFALRWAAHRGYDQTLIRCGRLADAKLAAPRPFDMSLNCDRAAQTLGRPAPPLDTSFIKHG